MYDGVLDPKGLQVNRPNYLQLNNVPVYKNQVRFAFWYQCRGFFYVNLKTWKQSANLCKAQVKLFTTVFMDDLAGNRRIYLVGMMGSGKSFWLGKLGHFYGLPAYDLDRLVETVAGKTIKDIFAESGEVTFRKMESSILQDGVPGTDYILACGGGTPCFFDNMEFMKKSGIVVWLNPSIDELVRRLSRGIDARPVLEGIHSPGALAEHLKNLMSKRLSWYQMAHIEINEDASIASITEKVNAFDRNS